MAEKITIGLVFAHNENWIGGTYYILNLIYALKTLPTEQQPNLVVFVGKPQDASIVCATEYPHLSFKPLDFSYSLLTRVINKIARKLVKRNLIQKKYPTHTAQVIFPYDLQNALSKVQKKICWIPDFQEHYLHGFFSKESLEARKNHQLTLIKQQYPIIFSSEDVQQNFFEIYPYAQNPTHVVNFATTHPPYKQLNIDDLRTKYAIKGSYVIAPNQFWKHKNHQIVLDSVLALSQRQAIDFQIVFTGKEHDFRYPDYADGLKKFVQENQLQSYVKFLGFIDRQDQLQLMNHALAVIQPSLFEGWSTVVEDAKAMNQFIIASDIKVHQEQLQSYKNNVFFNPKNHIQLVDILENMPTKKLEIKAYDYQQNIKKFALDFMKVIA